MRVTAFFFGLGAGLVLLGILQSFFYSWRTGGIGYPPKIMEIGLCVIAADMLITLICLLFGISKFGV